MIAEIAIARNFLFFIIALLIVYVLKTGVFAENTHAYYTMICIKYKHD